MGIFGFVFEGSLGALFARVPLVRAFLLWLTNFNDLGYFSLLSFYFWNLRNIW
jgi:hypothetical protein